MSQGKPTDQRLRWRLEPYWDWLVLVVFALPKALSLLVPRRRDLVLLGAGLQHIDNVLGVLMARPGPPAGTTLRVIANRVHRKDARLLAAVRALPDTKLLRRWSPSALWASLRAGWVLIPYRRTEVWRFFLGKAPIVYINHGPWMKRMSGESRPTLLGRFKLMLYGRIRIALASADAEVEAYRVWMGRTVEVLSLGYPRSPVLDEHRRAGLSPHKVGLWPTWQEFVDRSYGPDLAQRLHAALVAAGIQDACVDYRPHFLSGMEARTLGPDDGRKPALVVTDFSSVCFDQFYLGGKVLLYSRSLDRYLGTRGIRADLEPWLRSNLLDDEEALVRHVVAVLKGKDRGATDPLHLQPFDSAAFWKRLEATKA